MADRNRLTTRRTTRERKEVPEVTTTRTVKKDLKKEVNGDAVEMEDAAEPGESPAADGASTNGNAANGDVANGAPPVDMIELPPWEIIHGDRIDPFQFKFQFKNVEYSSGRNKTFLCYMVNTGDAADLKKGYVEDEHTGAHAEEAFFLETLPEYDSSLKYTVVWYVSSSPCLACATKIAEILKARKNMKMTIFAARLFEWEEPEIQAGLRAMHAAGCKLRMMKPLDYSYTWDTFVESDDQPLNLWEDCQENYDWYSEKLSDILQ